jgi:glutamate--cysteine ligase
VKSWSWSERLDVYETAPREALRTRVRGIPLLDLARELSAIARVGLMRQDVRNSRGENETIYLDSLDRQLALGRSAARVVAQRWETEWEERIDRLIDFAAYRHS